MMKMNVIHNNNNNNSNLNLICMIYKRVMTSVSQPRSGLAAE